MLRSSSVMPMMPFMGVRISWLMFARKSLLARLAVTAASFAVLAAAAGVVAGLGRRFGRSRWWPAALAGLVVSHVGGQDAALTLGHGADAAGLDVHALVRSGPGVPVVDEQPIVVVPHPLPVHIDRDLDVGGRSAGVAVQCTELEVHRRELGAVKSGPVGERVDIVDVLPTEAGAVGLVLI